MQDHWTRLPICNAGRSERGNVEGPDNARTIASRKQKQKNRRCHPAIVVRSAVLVVCALSAGKISRAWIASLKFFSPQPLSWMCAVSYYASSAAVNPDCLAILPRMGKESFGFRLYISPVPSFL